MTRTSFNNLNVVIITGNMVFDFDPNNVRVLGKDDNGNDIPVYDIRIASNDRIKKGDEWVSDPSFFDVTVKGKTVNNLARFAARGAPLTVHGRLKQENWVDKNTGEKKSKVKIVADLISFHAKPANDNGNTQPAIASVGASSVDGGDFIPDIPDGL